MSSIPLRHSTGHAHRSSISMHVEDLEDQHDDDIQREHDKRLQPASSLSSSSAPSPALPATASLQPSALSLSAVHAPLTPSFDSLAVPLSREPFLPQSSSFVSSSGAFELDARPPVRVHLKPNTTQEPDPFNFQSEAPPATNASADENHLVIAQSEDRETADQLKKSSLSDTSALAPPAPSGPPSPSNSRQNLHLHIEAGPPSRSTSSSPKDSQVVRFTSDDPFSFDGSKDTERDKDKKEMLSAKNVTIELEEVKNKERGKDLKQTPLPLVPGISLTSSTSSAPSSSASSSLTSAADSNWVNIYLNEPNRNVGRFPSNVIRTSKYTVFTFLFINLFEQFRRVANSYFLLIVILQVSTNDSPFPLYTNVAPLVIILAVGMLNAIREDYYRHKSDRIANSRPCRRIEKGKVVHCQSKDIETGQILEIHEGEEFPADLVLFASSHADAVAYVNTANLDGEAAPKVRYAPQATLSYTSAEALTMLKGKIKCEKPSAALYYFKGQLFLNDQLEENSAILVRAMSQRQKSARQVQVQHQNSSVGRDKNKDKAKGKSRTFRLLRKSGKANGKDVIEDDHEFDDAKVYPVSDKQLLLRGARLVNTERVWGLVAYTGPDTKLMLNRNPAKFKFSEFEGIMNQFVFICLGINFAVCLTVTLFFQYSSQSWANLYGIGSNSALDGFNDFITQYILFSFMIPLSLYVTIELVKVCQAQFMEWDNQMEYYDPDTKTSGRCVVKSSALNEELGVVDCICSDKTGTLTQNKMELSRCAVGGRLFFAKAEQIAPVNAALPQPKDKDKATKSSTPAHKHSISEFMRKWNPLLMKEMALLAFEDVMSEEEKRRMYDKEGALEVERQKLKMEGELEFYTQMYKHFMLCILLCNAALPSMKDDHGKASQSEDENEKKKQTDGPADHKGNDDPADEKDDTNDSLKTSLTIPSSSPPNPSSNLRKKMIFESQSPDEIALLDALHQCGVTLYQKQAAKVVVEIFTEYMSEPVFLNYELKAVLEFSSAFRRMSVVAVEQTSNEAWIYTKGADTTIEQMVLKRTELHRSLLDSLKIHATDFAGTGSRTLVLAGRPLPSSEFSSFYPAYQAAETSLDDRDALIESLFRTRIESDLQLLGCSAVEDQLQELVPEAVDFLLAAKVKIIVVTGDKMETAVTIGKQCHLIQPSARLFYMGGLTKEEVEKNITHILTLIQAEKEQWEVRSRSEFVNTENEIPPVFATAIDGVSLELCIHHWKPQLVGLLSACSTVICYRSTPKQKALTVRLVKEELHLHCLAIGDGANDVSMILESHVGVGILGKEGAHAAMSADFVIRRFHHLRRLLAVHGRYNFFRTAQVVFFCFYKNFAMPLPLVWFQFFCGGTGTLAYDSLLLSCFNTFFTSVPPFFAGIFDKDVQERTLMSVPQAFAAFRWKKFFGFRGYFEAIITAAWHSLVVFFAAYFLWNQDQIGRGGVNLDLFYMGNSMMTSVVIITSVYMLVSSEYINALSVFGILFGWAWYIGIFVFVNNSWEPSLSATTYGVATQIFLDSIPWLYFLITVIVSLMPWIVYKTFKRELHPTFYQQLQKFDQVSDEEWEKEEKHAQTKMNEVLYSFPEMHVKTIAAMNPTDTEKAQKKSSPAIAIEPKENGQTSIAMSGIDKEKEKMKGITIKVNEHEQQKAAANASAVRDDGIEMSPPVANRNVNRREENDVKSEREQAPEEEKVPLQNE